MPSLEQHKKMARKMVSEHKIIEDTADQINEIFQEPFEESKLVQLKKLCSSINDCLIKHFKLEEDSGILQDLVEDAPNMSGRVRKHHEEHLSLSEGMKSICEKIQGVTAQDMSLLQALKKDFSLLVVKLKKHEIEENLMVLDTYNLDIGGED